MSNQQTIDSNLSMWDYNKEKYGIIDAIKEQYPVTLKTNIKLQMLLTQHEVMTDCIDITIKRLIEENKL